MPAMQLMAIGGIVNSALYIAGVFLAGLATGNDVVWKAAIATAGLTYLSYLANMALLAGLIPEWIARASVIVSVALGASAGIALLF